jgi:hypothetical protein
MMVHALHGANHAAPNYVNVDEIHAAKKYVPGKAGHNFRFRHFVEESTEEWRRIVQPQREPPISVASQFAQSKLSRQATL